MRIYPFGSSSLNPVYNPSLIVTSSTSVYAATASLAIRAVSASYAHAGVDGTAGYNGICIY